MQGSLKGEPSPEQLEKQSQEQALFNPNAPTETFTEHSEALLPEPHAPPYSQAEQLVLWNETAISQERKNTIAAEPTVRRRVRERREQENIHSLTLAELIAIIFSTYTVHEGAAQKIQQLCANYTLQELLQVETGELQNFLGKRKAEQFQALTELARRLTIPSAERYQIISPLDAANLVMPQMAFLDHEEVRVLALDTKNHVVANTLMYLGSLNSSVLRIPEIFRPAITRNCAGIIICHNHPTGSTEPSVEDIDITRQLVEAGKLLEIELLDHLIIGNHRYLSLKERMLW